MMRMLIEDDVVVVDDDDATVKCVMLRPFHHDTSPFMRRCDEIY